MKYNEQELLEELKIKFSCCKHHDYNGFTFSVITSGASGGNCWGDNASHFQNSDEEIISEMKSEIIYCVRDFLNLLDITLDKIVLEDKAQHFAENNIHFYFDTEASTDYYGNYSNYNSYFVSFDNVLDFVDDIPSAEKSKILDIANKAKEFVVDQKNRDGKLIYLKEIQKLIHNFKTDSLDAESKLHLQLKRANEEVLMLTNKLNNLDKEQQEKLTTLQKKEKELNDFLYPEDSKQPSKKTKKNGC